MAYLEEQFNKFYKEICISQEADELRRKRNLLKEDIEKYLPDNLKKIDIEINKSDFEFINQGSYSIHTTISNPHGPVDLDYAVIIPIEINKHTDTRAIKKAVRDSLNHVAARTVNIKEPCVTVSYYIDGDEDTHIDFPVYAKYNNNLYLARGKEFSNEGNYFWEDADPKELNKYFNDFLDGNDSLRKTIRYIKKWKQAKYSNSSNDSEIPPSVALTILTCQNFVNKDHDILSLHETLKAIKNKFTVIKNSNGEIVEVNITCNLPVKPYGDVLYKMRSSKSHLIKFYNNLCKAVDNLKAAIDLEDEHEAGKYIQQVFGDLFVIPEKQVKETYANVKRENSFG